MMSGKTRSALHLLSKRSNQTRILGLDEEIEGKTVRDILKDKHPQPKSASIDALITPSADDIPGHLPSILFEGISPEDIRHAALHTEGSAGPSGLEAMAWRRICTAFGKCSNDLCSSLASFAKRISTSYVDPSGLSAYTACRLIPLDKHPGIRPIGIGEVCRRIIGKTIMKYAKSELQRSMGPLQLCAGHNSGCEAAVHAMKIIFEEEDTEAMIFVDATNAFNQLNREVTIYNTQAVCPALAPTLINTYRSPPSLFINGECIPSLEGTTQGDPLGLVMYAIGIQPLVHKLTGIAQQVWYADDSSAGSSLENVKKWWDKLSHLGPLYGYYPNGLKTKLLVKPGFIDQARDLFENTGIEVHTDGEKYLGGAIGNESFLKNFLQ